MMETSDDEDYSSVDLGFLEKSESWRLRSEFFRSKVGGKPAWLDLAQVPTRDRVLCGKCENPCIFLCQIYAPIEEKDDCFHRTLFIFMCQSPECCQYNDNANFRVLRSQLSRRNDFFAYVPPEESENYQPPTTVANFCKLCNVCGLNSTSCCGKCRRVLYCSQQHQVADWKAGHKLECGVEGAPIRKPPLLLPEWELVMGSEPIDRTEKNLERSNEEKLQEYQALVQSGKAGTLHGDESANEDLLAMAGHTEDKPFKEFKKCIAISPEQVLRYERGGQPLWVSSKGQAVDVPPCKYCGTPMIFECQVLPQMLNFLSLDQKEHSIDWGTLVIFTCQRSCQENGSPAYKDELLIKQDFNLIDTISDKTA